VFRLNEVLAGEVEHVPALDEVRLVLGRHEEHIGCDAREDLRLQRLDVLGDGRRV
jgi:hypothetical protein